MNQRYVVSYTGRYYINVDMIVCIEIDKDNNDLLLEDSNENVYTLFSGCDDQLNYVLDRMIKWLCDPSTSSKHLFYIYDVHKSYMDSIAESERHEEN